MSRHVLDARHLLCPLPVIRVQNTVARLAPGDILEVRATDPGALHDIPAWCRVHGHEVLSAVEADGEMRVTLKVGAS
ncbi:MAG TPA: sulfurtransferase TusA family protein [Burkholderiales bacterium]